MEASATLDAAQAAEPAEVEEADVAPAEQAATEPAPTEQAAPASAPTEVARVHPIRHVLAQLALRASPVLAQCHGHCWFSSCCLRVVPVIRRALQQRLYGKCV